MKAAGYGGEAEDTGTRKTGGENRRPRRGVKCSSITLVTRYYHSYNTKNYQLVLLTDS